MRRTVASSVLVPVLGLALGLTACSGDDPGAAPAPTTAVTSPTGTVAPTSPAVTDSSTGPAPATSSSPPVDVCGQVDAADVQSLFGGDAGEGVPVPARNSDGGCRWALTGATVGGTGGAVTVSVQEGVNREAFTTTHVDPATAAPLAGVGDVAYLDARAHTLTFLKGSRATTVTGDFGAYDAARFQEARIQTSLVGFAALLAR